MNSLDIISAEVKRLRKLESKAEAAWDSDVPGELAAREIDFTDALRSPTTLAMLEALLEVAKAARVIWTRLDNTPNVILAADGDRLKDSLEALSSIAATIKDSK